MKANELRIGNYVSDIHASNSFFAPVKKIDFTRCFYGQFNCAYSDLKPIPLTEEWLLRFGFEKNDSGRYDKRMELCFDGKYYYFRQGWTNVQIKHVHTLQNLYFALTGEELTLK